MHTFLVSIEHPTFYWYTSNVFGSFLQARPGHTRAAPLAPSSELAAEVALGRDLWAAPRTAPRAARAARAARPAGAGRAGKARDTAGREDHPPPPGTQADSRPLGMKT